VLQSFQSIAKSELGFRELDLTPNDVLMDTIQTCLLIARREKNSKDDKMKFNEIKVGIHRFTNYTIGSRFRIEKVIESAAKTAWFATRLLSENFTKIELYDSEIDLSEFEIKSVDLNFLNRLKRINKAAFYYWYNCIEELDEKTFKI